jgi:hypothetical protein
MPLEIRRLFTIVDEKLSEDGHADGGPPLRRVAAVAVVVNPLAGQPFAPDLSGLVADSAVVGERLAQMAVAAMAPHAAQSYGKGGVVGLAGAQGHVNALLTTTFAEPLRQAVGGGAAWISSFTKRGAPGVSLDVPLAHKDALYVRSHYDGMTLTLPDAPQADEIALVVVLANGGRIGARVGGLAAEAIEGRDGLR